MIKGFLFLALFLLQSAAAFSDHFSDSLEAKLPAASGEDKFNLLTSLAKHYSRFDISRSLDYASRAHDLAREANNLAWLATSLNSLAIIHYNKGQNQTALKYFREYLLLLEREKESSGDRNRHLMNLLKGYNNIGNVYNSLGEHEKALEAFLTALSVMDSLPVKERNPDLHNSLINNAGLVYLDLGDFGKAREMFTQALETARKGANDLNVSIALNNLGLVSIEVGEYPAALGYYLEAVEIGTRLNDSIALGGYYNNIGLIYEKQQLWDMALFYYEHSLALSRRLGYAWGIANTLGNIGNIHLATGKYDKAGVCLGEALEIAKGTGIKSLIMKIYTYLFDLYNKQNVPSEALKYHLLYTQLKDSVFNEEKSMQIADMQAKYELDKKEKENELLKEKDKSRRATQGLLTGGLAGLIVLSVMLFTLFRLRTRSLKREKTIRILEGEKKEIEKQRLEEQIFAEQQINRLQAEKIEQKDRELSAGLIHIMNKNEALKSVLKQMEVMDHGSDNDLKDRLRKLTHIIRNNVNLDHDWEQFKRHFCAVHPSFFDNLNHRHPGLTPHEQRLCAYLRINLNTKEIAQMLNVSADAVIKSRYRLRKKLGTESEADLVAFMNGF
jgi:tetratricopeptide (TPR) repeat protein/DNA-binding CsgD family transcriptional regulator